MLRVAGVCFIGVTSVILAETVFWRLFLCTEETDTMSRRAANLSDSIKKAKAKIANLKDDKKKAKEEKSLVMLDKEYRKIAVFSKSIELRRQALVYACIFCVVVLFLDLRGPPVANLPFTAMFPIKKITHLGLDGDDYTQLSPVGLLLMCVSATSAMVRNALDFNLPQSLITAGRDAAYAYTESMVEGSSSDP